MKIYSSQHLLSFQTSFLTCVRLIKLNTLDIQALKIETHLLGHTAVSLCLPSLLRPRDKVLGNRTLCLRDDWDIVSPLRGLRKAGKLPSHLLCEMQLCQQPPRLRSPE